MNAGKAILAGLIGTIVMTLLTMMAGVMGLPMDIPAMLSSFMGASILIGWLAHFMIGMILALFYAYGFVSWLPGTPWLKGALYGLFPFVVAQVVIMPMMGMGLFTSNAPNAFLLVMGSLMGHLIYGAVVGAIYGTPQQGSLSSASS